MTAKAKRVHENPGEKACWPRARYKGVYEWPIREKEASRFDWHYDTDETCYLLEGRVEVYTPYAAGLKEMENLSHIYLALQTP